MCNLTLPDPEFPPVWYMRNSNGSSTNGMLLSTAIRHISEYVTWPIY